MFQLPWRPCIVNVMEPNTFTVALLQLAPPADATESLRIGLDACEAAASQGADLAVFPEMWNVGYRFPSPERSVERWRRHAIAEEDEYYRSFARSAADLDMAIALTYLRHNPDGNPFNAVSIIDRTGVTRLTYSKVHTCDFSREINLTPGREFPVCDLATSRGSVTIGAMICYDREFPESARILMLEGAQLLVVPNACDFDVHRKHQLQTRSFENMVGCAVVNYGGEPYGGKSVAFDGMAYTLPPTEEDGVVRDMELVEAGSDAEIVLARFDIDALREYRAREAWGNAYRRPALYNALIDPTVRAPFQRSDARR